MVQICLRGFQIPFSLQLSNFVVGILLIHIQDDSGACKVSLASNLLQRTGNPAPPIIVGLITIIKFISCGASPIALARKRIPGADDYGSAL